MFLEFVRFRITDETSLVQQFNVRVTRMRHVAEGPGTRQIRARILPRKDVKRQGMLHNKRMFRRVVSNNGRKNETPQS